MQRRAVAVVYAEAVEGRCEGCDVGRHVFPEPGVVVCAVSVAQLDAVAPDDDFAPQICFGGREGEVLQRVGVPYPAVVGEKPSRGVVFVGLEASEVRLYKRESGRKSLKNLQVNV